MAVFFFPGCNFVGYVYLFVVIGVLYLIFKAVIELNKLKGHHPEG